MIKSFLDNDLYAFTQMFAVLSNKELSNLKVRFNFFNRNDTKFPDGFDLELKKRVQDMSNLKMTKDEKSFFISKCGSYLPNWFFDLLEGFRFDPNEVFIYMEDGNLKVKYEGFAWRLVLWETPLLAMISELYFEMTNKQYDFNSSSNRNTRLDKNKHKAQMMVMNNLKVSEFGTRRRYSYDNQKEVLGDLISYGKKSIVGTSNVHLAHIFNINPHGTQGHLWFMIHSALYGYKQANKVGLDNWVKTYQGNLGISLSDTYTSDVFFKSFDMLYSKLFDGVRNDSGDPFQYADKVVKHYNSLNIDYSNKTIIYSNGLNLDLSVKIQEYCNKLQIKSSYGIGTFLTNDIGFKPLNIVIKIVQVFVDGEWHDVVKLSDDYGKQTGKEVELDLCKRTLNIPDITYNHQPAGNEDDKPKINIV